MIVSSINQMCLIHIILVIFFFTTLRPPISTLFPYTTLFRSRLFVVEILVEVLFVGVYTRDKRHQHDERQQAHPGVPEDRKSTRLNSSHVEISYAVFCLKKKKSL